MRAASLLVVACCGARETTVAPQPPLASSNVQPAARRELVELPLVDTVWHTSGTATLANGWLDLEYGIASGSTATALTPVLDSGRWRLLVNHANSGCKDGTRVTIHANSDGRVFAAVMLSGSTRSSVATADIELTAPTSTTIRIGSVGSASCAGETTIRNVVIEPI
jgi:hypothetical protein